MTCLFYSSDIDWELYKKIKYLCQVGTTSSSKKVLSKDFLDSARLRGLTESPVLAPLVFRCALCGLSGVNLFYSYKNPASYHIHSSSLVDPIADATEETLNWISKLFFTTELVNCLLLNKLEPELKALVISILTLMNKGTEIRSRYQDTSQVNINFHPIPIGKLEPVSNASSIRLTYCVLSSLDGLSDKQKDHMATRLLVMPNCPKDVRLHTIGQDTKNYYETAVRPNGLKLSALKHSRDRASRAKLKVLCDIRQISNCAGLITMQPHEKIKHLREFSTYSDQPVSFLETVNEPEVQQYLQELRSATS